MMKFFSGCTSNKAVSELSEIMFRGNEASRRRMNETGFNENWTWKQRARSPFFCFMLCGLRGCLKLDVAKTFKVPCDSCSLKDMERERARLEALIQNQKEPAAVEFDSPLF